MNSMCPYATCFTGDLSQLEVSKVQSICVNPCLSRSTWTACVYAAFFFRCIALAAMQRPRFSDVCSVNVLMWIVQMCEQESADLSTRKHMFMFALRAAFNHHLREFVRTHVILAIVARSFKIDDRCTVCQNQ